MIMFSSEFKRVVKEAFPQDKELHQSLEEGSTVVGTILFDKVQKFQSLVTLWTKEVGRHFHGDQGC